MKHSQTGVGKSKKASWSMKTRAAPANARSAERVHQAIAVAAYYRAERRNFEPGHELEDWLDAEAEVLAEIESLKEEMPA